MKLSDNIIVMYKSVFSFNGHKCPTWVKGLCSPVQQANVNAAQVNNVVQSCYHHSPYSSNRSHHSVDQKEEIGQEEKTLSKNPNRTSELTGAILYSTFYF